VIKWLINRSLNNHFLVVLAAVCLLFGGTYAVKQTPVDALPDLSDVQVIIKTEYAGQAPQVVEDQVTYPLTTALMSAPGAVDVRGVSLYGSSLVYVLFEDGVDIYWARARVLEYLNQVRLPNGVRASLGPDATGVGWVFNYALVDRSGQHDLAQLRSLQDWYLKPQLQSLKGVSEVASVGGMTRQYQVIADPDKLRAYGITLAQLEAVLSASNRESGASVVELAEAEYMLRISGYLNGLEDLRALPVRVTAGGTPVLVSDLAQVRLGPSMRRGIAELNGEGEVAGGIVVMRFGGNAQQVIARVKTKLLALQSGLPDGIELVTTYDRSTLVEQSIQTLTRTLIIQLLVVMLICALFLWHLRSSLVVVISLPLGILGAFMLMQLQGLNANIMSLGGIAVAIGSMVDGAIVMLENFHKTLQQHRDQYGVESSQQRWKLVRVSSLAVGPPLFFSLLIEAVSFMPVFSLQAQEGRLFAPLAFTKSYAMVVAAGLTITLVPVLIGYLVRGPLRAELSNPLNRGLQMMYRPLLRWALRSPKALLLIIGVSLFSAGYPLAKLGSEFMPPLDEGDLMYMPTTQAGISVGEARRLLQVTDRLIMTQPEVLRVFGKIGRADTATDPAPLTMIETLIQFKPRAQWRAGMTPEKVRAELDVRLQLPGVSNAWVMPIRTRIDMLATGIKTPLGLVVTGPDLNEISRLGQSLEALLMSLPGSVSVYAERVVDSRYIQVEIDRLKAARFGLNMDELHGLVATAIGGRTVTQTVEGIERYPVNLRYPQAYRDSVRRLRDMPILTPQGQTIALADVAQVYIEQGPSVIRTENTRPAGRVLIDIQGRDLGAYVAEAKQRIDEQLSLPAGYSLEWSGQYEYLQRATERLQLIVPVTLVFIIMVLFLTFRRGFEVVLILAIIPTALLGGLWLIYWQGVNLSVAVGVGFIALAGVTVGNAIMMLVYLNQSLEEAVSDRTADENNDLLMRLERGALQRLRPIMMTVLTVLLGLLPLLLTDGVGAEVMQSIALPMVGGIVTSLLSTLLLIPSLYGFYLISWRRR